jgi:hypothetical protein
MPTLYDRVRNVRFNQVRKSPIYRVLQVIPTPARPWLLALESIHQVRDRQRINRFERREAKLKEELQEAKSRRKGTLGIGRILLAVGLTLLATNLNRSRQGKIRVSGFMPTPTREPATKP